MFMEIDLATPLQQSYIRNLKVKNTVLNYWPTKFVDDVEVFDVLYMWLGGVPDDTAHKELYKLLGTSVEELQKHNWAHIDAAWFYLKPYHLDKSSIELSEQDVANYINNNTELGKEYEVAFTYTQEFAGSVVSSANKIDHQQIIDLIEGGYNSLYDPAIIDYENDELNSRVKPTPVYSNSMITYDTEVNPCTFASIMDVDNVLFDSTTKVVTATVILASDVSYYNDEVYRNSSLGLQKYTIKASISYKFKRIRDANDAEVSELIGLIKDKALSLTPDPFSFYKQVQELLHAYNPVLPGELAYEYSTNPLFAAGTTQTYIRKDAASELKPTDFSKMLKDSIATDYIVHKKKRGFFSFLVAVVVMVIAVLTIQPELVALDITATAGTVAYAAAWFGLLSLNLTIGSLLLAYVADYLGKHGNYGLAIVFQGSLVILGKLSEVVGYMAMLTGLSAMWEKLTSAATQNAVKELAVSNLEASGKIATEEAIAAEISANPAVYNTVAANGVSAVVTPTLTNYVKAGWELVTGNVTNVFSNYSKSPLAVVNKVVDWLNTGFSVYAKWINPVKMPASGEQAGDQTPPTSVQDIAFKQAYFDGYAFLDVNAQMEAIPDNMTTPGLMRETLDKFYVS